MTTHVADASAILAMLDREPGHQRVEAALAETVMSTVNLAEIVTSLINKGIPAADARRTTESLEIETVPLDRELALAAGVLREGTRSHGLSLGDRACLALGRHLALPVLTADRTWADLDVGIEIQLIR
ncbi:MAG: type II toxin-antitoxin system VapC family toxin [Alphaproteobacteria bacterium]|nr:type II toxin-antitoxin system VapC family toxin [Pseudomonadota bacterium]MCZ6467359.1 type II toxin-antitoxin system VapC family toxin [Alphaproteobacteria bacterium]